MGIEALDLTKKDEFTLAVRATKGGDFRKLYKSEGALTEELVNEGTVLLGRTGGETVMAHSHEAFGQNMQTPAPNEFVGLKFEDAGFSGGAVGPFEKDTALAVVA